jgi:DNA polymerase-3 subunit gamma/tau
MHITLYRKYRPMDFDEMAGEGEIIKTVKNSLKRNRLSHAYLFTGPRGVGKTTTARLIAKGVNCLTKGITDEPCNVCDNCVAINQGNFLDLYEIDAASNRGIDEIRELKENIGYKPSKGQKKVYIIDEVHMLTKEAFNALLKTLEEPPEHALFILATTEPDKVLPTIVSRCQRYDFKPISEKDMVARLKYICEKENIQIDIPSLKLIYETSGGSARDAISILERVIVTYLGEEINLEKCEKALGVTPQKRLQEFLKVVQSNERDNGIEAIDQYISEGMSIELFFKDFAKYVKGLALRGELDIKKALEYIDIIYDVLHRFKYEEEKELVGFVILNRIFKDKEETNVNIKAEEKVVYLPENKPESGQELTLAEIKDKWNAIINEVRKKRVALTAFLMGATPHKYSNGVLTIGFKEENIFGKEQLESARYSESFKEIVDSVLGADLKIEYEVIEKKHLKNLNVHDEREEFTKKVIEFFGGEVLDS